MKSAAQLNLIIKSKLKKPDFLFIKKLARSFPECEIYLVGGAVRDHLLSRKEIKDYDLVVRNVPANKLQKELQKLGWVDLVGKSFGVLKFMPVTRQSKGSAPRTGTAGRLEPFDIALPRTEHASGEGGYRDFEVQSNPKLSIVEDLSRRDFTINAIAVRVYPKFELVDPFDGLKDLKSKKIRTVGKPAERFQEDYSRLMRALRFCCQLGFAIEQATWQELCRLMPKIDDLRPRGTERVVPYETIAKEMLKAFYQDPLKAFDLFHDSGAMARLMPELLKMKNCPQPDNYHTEGDVWTHARMAVGNLCSKTYRKLFGQQKPSAQVVMAVMYHDVAKPMTIKTPEKDGTDRIRFNEHDTIGGKIIKSAAERLKWASAGLGVDPDQLDWLVSHHLILVHANVEDIKNTTLEKYFFNPNNPGQDLLKLLYADGSATIPVGGKPKLHALYRLIKRLEQLKKILGQRPKAVEPILDGNQIMKQFKLKPGRLVGELLSALREEQLSKKVATKPQAVKFLKTYLARKK